jgi:hypothetical protein
MQVCVFAMCIYLIYFEPCLFNLYYLYRCTILFYFVLGECMIECLALLPVDAAVEVGPRSQAISYESLLHLLNILANDGDDPTKNDISRITEKSFAVTKISDILRKKDVTDKNKVILIMINYTCSFIKKQKQIMLTYFFCYYSLLYHMYIIQYKYISHFWWYKKRIQ